MRQIAAVLFVALVLKTVLLTIKSYTGYFPPDFRTDFLIGRRSYFFGWYQNAFYAHILSGPASLVLGLVLLSKAVRRRFPAWHRRVGKLQIACVLLLVAPSGLAMAFRAPSPLAVVGFATLAVATAACVALGWRAAVQRRFGDHARWMTRGFALLSSAVLLRVLGGASEVLGVAGTYPYAAWLSWLIPLALVEAWLITRQPSPPPPR